MVRKKKEAKEVKKETKKIEKFDMTYRASPEQLMGKINEIIDYLVKNK